VSLHSSSAAKSISCTFFTNDVDPDPHSFWSTGSRRAKMTQKIKEISSSEILDVLFWGISKLQVLMKTKPNIFSCEFFSVVDPDPHWPTMLDADPQQLVFTFRNLKVLQIATNRYNELTLKRRQIFLLMSVACSGWEGCEGLVRVAACYVCPLLLRPAAETLPSETTETGSRRKKT
jgi:hypothetical protein